MMTGFLPLLEGLMLGGGLIIAIGAQNAFILRQGLLRQHVFILCMAASSVDAVLIILGIAGMGSLVQANPELLFFITLAGALFLTAYAFLAARRACFPDAMKAEGENAGSLKRALSILFAFTLLNPHVYLDTVVLIGGIASQYEGQGRLYFAIGSCAASFIWFFSVGYGARYLAPLFEKPVAWRVLDCLIAIVMATLALSLYWRAFS